MKALKGMLRERLPREGNKSVVVNVISTDILYYLPPFFLSRVILKTKKEIEKKNCDENEGKEMKVSLWSHFMDQHFFCCF